MTSTTPAVEHGITITEVSTSAGTPRRADCFCGWHPRLVAANPIALAEGEAHLIRAATENAREVRERIEAGNAAGYPAAVADRIAQTISDSEPLTVDQIAEVAGTLDCATSRLLPPHGTSPIGDNGPVSPTGDITTVSANPASHGMPLTRAVQTASTSESMRYPSTDAHGRVFDLFVPSQGGRDSFIDDCPAWCEMANQHSAESCDEDRKHWGQIYRVPIRAMTADYEPADDDRGLPAGYLTGAATVYLQREALHREPQIWLGKVTSARRKRSC